jgi:hypothetical protein
MRKVDTKIFSSLSGKENFGFLYEHQVHESKKSFQMETKLQQPKGRKPSKKDSNLIVASSNAKTILSFK